MSDDQEQKTSADDLDQHLEQLKVIEPFSTIEFDEDFDYKAQPRIDVVWT